MIDDLIRQYNIDPSRVYAAGGSNGAMMCHQLACCIPDRLAAITVVVAGQFALSGTVFGRHALALGANPESARLSGIRTRALTVSVFALSGVLASLAGMMQCSRLGAADPNAGIGFELQAIAAAVIGGTSLMGGRGSVVNSFFGVIIIAVLAVGLATLGAQESTKRLVTGGVIVAAVILDYYRHRLNKA
ncbi:MAG TPA: PHB depolymerase family esterase [Candidatus Bathyarchaeia archaeon]|nr:PHB depolymerase family esterase [Candidatus Bathyarchaeia archaeon]